ncbi:hypothetical protein MTO96_041837, partial [Rhipicephalus appendiculatus]
WKSRDPGEGADAQKTTPDMDVDSVALESFLELNFPSELNFATPIEYPSFNTTDAILQTTVPTTATQQPTASAVPSSVLGVPDDPARSDYGRRRWGRLEQP